MRKNFDIPSIRARLANKDGKEYWRSLEEIAETDEFQDLLKHEFPQGTDQWLDPIGRRNFLKLMAASLALGGLAACAPRPQEEILAPVEGIPEYTAYSEPLHYATAFELSGVAMGLLAQSHLGRPTKLDGNPDHPASLGSSDVFAQATLLEMYDPDRARNITNAGTVVTWNTFTQELNLLLEGQSATDGAGLRILTETITSPSLHHQLEAVLEAFPEARWYQYEPINRDNARAGAEMAFGEDVNTVYDISQADVIVSLDANFMTDGPARVRYSKDFAAKRRIRTEGIEVKHGEVVGDEDHSAQLDALTMSRLYMVETTPSATGTLADHLLPMGTAQIEGFARMLAAELGVSVDAPSSVEGLPDDWVPAIAEDLQANAGNALIIPGPYQSPAVHALAHAMNDVLGNVGTTVTYTDPLEAEPTNQVEGLRELVDDMNNNNVDMLVIIDANPVYNAPADIDFAAAMENVSFRARMGLYEDETSALCQWNVARKHFLEMWGDTRAYDGSISIVQPLIQPLYDDRSPLELLAAMLPETAGTAEYDLVRAYWQEESGASDGEFDDVWRDALFNGMWADSALPAKSVSASLSGMPDYETSDGIEITFRPDPSIWDGRFANNGWLQELPKPNSKLTWDNVAALSPTLAEEEGISNGDMLRIEFDGRSILAPAWVQPGQAHHSITLTLGYGRERVGRVGDNVGVSAFRLLTTDNYWMAPSIELLNTGESYTLASTQSHYNIEGRDFVREGTLAMFQEDPAFSYVTHEVSTDLSLMPADEWEYTSYKWGMTVDLSACNGCNACVVACQAENNIPIVGKDQVVAGREMHWMRIDTYFNGELDNPATMNQPMMCQHCEQAPCELVCPVNATVHDAEGLNVMVYNRCIGTRYCSNNCPYKVRRFNFLYYNNNEFNTGDSLLAMRNPEVTVRTRGVMEKCTYCIQRISSARIKAKVDDRRIADGEVVTACQAACPTDAIVFGDTNDPDTAVSKEKKQPQKYGVLTELGVRPQTSYMTRIKNPNPAIEGSSVVVAPHGE